MYDSIAVLLPVCKKDNPDFFAVSVDSLLAQKEVDFNIFLGVDGPIGGALEKRVQECEENKVFFVCRFPENRGLACVLNDLLDICFDKGYEYVARMDADDISMPDRFEKQMAYLKMHPEVDVVGGAIEEIDENGNSRGKIVVYPETPEECYKFFARRNPHAHPAVLFRKRFFEKTGCKYRPEYRQNQDTMLWLDGMKADTLHANIPDVVLKFRFTDSLFKKRRNGWAFAKKQLADRKMINKTLGYGLGATIFAYMMFVMLVSPAWVKKIAYKMFR